MTPIMKRAFCLFLAIGFVAAITVVALKRASSCIPDCPALHQAATYGDISAIQDILASGEGVNTQATNGWTPLHYAALAGHLDVATYLLDHGADANAGSEKCRLTPLFSAVTARNPSAATAMTDLLLQRGADPNATIPGGETPLILAAARGRADIVELLLDAGAFVNARGDEGKTPLHNAAATTSVQTVQLIIDAGARVDALNDRGATAVSFAREASIVELLVQRGAKIDHLSGDGWTPLMKAASAGDCHLVTYLLCEGADPDIADNRGWTALHYAAVNGRPECAELILIAGANPTPKNADGVTPLSLAADEVTAHAIFCRGGS